MDDEVLDNILALKADKVDELEAMRIKTENRLRAFRQNFDMDGDSTEVQDEQWMLKELNALEVEAIKELQDVMSVHRMQGFVDTARGLGYKQVGRLLAVIGDPYVKPASFDEDGNVIEKARPRRGPAELWQYCGHGDPARSRRRKGKNGRKGPKIEYSPKAKTRLWLISKQVIKNNNNKYRELYDQEREFKKDAVHTTKCPQCTDSGGVGQSWKPGHQHAHALRYVGKAILKDMYNYSKELHEAEAARKRRMKKRRMAAKKAAATR